MRISDWSSDVCSSDLAEAAPARDIPLDAMIEKEPVTVILSKRGWIRAQRGHVAADQWGEFKFKDGDELLFAAHAQTTDKLLIAASDGRFFTVGADKDRKSTRLNSSH